MSIQQSMNQLLTTATIGAGLYAQTPTAKERFEVRGLQRQIPKVNAVFSKGLEEAQKKDEAARAAGIENPTHERNFLDTIGQESLDTSANLSERLAMLRPTEGHFQQAEQNRLAAEENRAEKTALTRQIATQTQRSEQDAALDERKAFLRQLDEMRARGDISGSTYKKLTYKFNQGGTT